MTARISPAEVIAIYGPGIGPTTAVTATPANGFYPTTLGGVQVTVNGVNIPLLYVSSNQINAVVPMELSSNASSTFRVINGTAVSPDYPVWIVDSTPQAFAPVINQDGTLNSQSNPAHGGSIVTFYATGWQSSFSPLSDGQVAKHGPGCLLRHLHCECVHTSVPFYQPALSPRHRLVRRRRSRARRRCHSIQRPARHFIFNGHQRVLPWREQSRS